MVINLIIDHDRVHPPIFISNKGRCVQIQIQKLKFAIIVKHFHFFFFSFFLYIFFSRLYSSKQCYISRLSFATIPICLHFSSRMVDFSFFWSFASRFVSVTATALFFTTYIQLVPTSLIYIYIYFQLFFI